MPQEAGQRFATCARCDESQDIAASNERAKNTTLALILRIHRDTISTPRGSKKSSETPRLEINRHPAA